MKSEICFGVGLGLGLMAGLLVMNNCKSVRQKVADTQNTVFERLEQKKREMASKAAAHEFAEDVADINMQKTPSAEL